MTNPYLLPLADCRHDIATGRPTGTAARLAGLIWLAWQWDEDHPQIEPWQASIQGINELLAHAADVINQRIGEGMGVLWARGEAAA